MEALSTQLPPFFQWLVKASFQASLLVCLILLIRLVLRERLPIRWHYYLWLLLLVRLSLPWSPQSRLSIYNLYQPSRWARPIQFAAEDTAPQPTAAGQAEGSIQTQAKTNTGAEAAQKPGTRATFDSQHQRSTPLPEGDRTGAHWANVLAALPVFWLAGAIALGGYVLSRNIWLWRAVKKERAVTDQAILDLLEDCKMEMRVQTIVGVVVTDRIESPALFGFVRPRILLPQGLIETLGLDELHYVFLHELAHLRRLDIYLAWLVCLLQVLHWFNPLIWFAFRRMRADQEMACDALVLSRISTDEPAAYGHTIVSLLDRFSRPQYVPSLAGILENPSHIERRMTMIAKFKSGSYRLSALGIVLVIALACVSLPDAPRAKASEKPSFRAKAGPTLRRVMDCTANAAVSSDARLVCYPKYDDSGELVVHNLITGKEHIIKASAGAAGQEGDPMWPVFSPDGRTIAYMVADEQEDQKQKAHQRGLYLIGADGTNKRLLCRGSIPVVWSSDGKRILVTIASKDDLDYIISVSTEDGSIEKRIEFPTKRWQAASLSPDGRYLAFDRPQEGDPNATWYAGKWDIFALDLNTGQESAIVRNPAGEVLLGWAPSGRYILFLSDRMGTWDAWLQPMADAVLAGQTQLVSRNLGHVRPGRFARDGSYYYQVAYNSSRIYFGEIDPHTAQVVSAPKALEGTGFDTCVDWSPDGRFAAYCSRNPDRLGPFTIHIHDVAAGTERRFELDAKLEVVGYLRWFPDGKSLLISSLWNYTLGPEYNEKEGIDSRVYRIDVESGKSTVLMQSERRRVKGAELSPDGKTLFYSCSSILRDEKDRAGNSLLIRRDLASGEEKTLFEFSAGTGWSFAVSRSGEFVAIAPNEQEGSSDTRTEKIMLIPSAGGQTRELVRWDETPGVIWGVAWTPDGKGILFVLRRDINDDTTMELWYVLTDASPPRKIMEADLGGWSGLRVHPDGRHIVFDAAARRDFELWAMENIPVEGIAAKEPK